MIVRLRPQQASLPARKYGVQLRLSLSLIGTPHSTQLLCNILVASTKMTTQKISANPNVVSGR